LTEQIDCNLGKIVERIKKDLASVILLTPSFISSLLGSPSPEPS
jgi:hypothetical protein